MEPACKSFATVADGLVGGPVQVAGLGVRVTARLRAGARALAARHLLLAQDWVPVVANQTPLTETERERERRYIG